MAACPICGKPAASRSENRTFPFCSTRCRQIDLGKWLDEDYRIPTGPAPSEAEQTEPRKKETN